MSKSILLIVETQHGILTESISFTETLLGENTTAMNQRHPLEVLTVDDVRAKVVVINRRASSPLLWMTNHESSRGRLS